MPTTRTLGMLANVVPFIPGEEEKLEREAFKILGTFAGDGVIPASFELAAQCNRVPVMDGHTLCVTVELEEEARRDELLHTWRNFGGMPQDLELPSAPDPAIEVHEDDASPQPALHRDAGGGMTVHVGRIRERSPREWMFTTLSHNTVRGAAGGSILLAELALATGRF